MRHSLQRPHVAWAEQNSNGQGIANEPHERVRQPQALAVMPAATSVQNPNVKASGVLHQQPVRSTAAHDNSLFEANAVNRPPPGINDLTGFAQQITSALESLQQEVRTFQSEMLHQVSAMSSLNAEHLQLIARDV